MKCFSYVYEPLKTGQIWGNRFGIVVRNAQVKESLDSSIIDSALESLKNNGFINYFGMQRFGNCEQISTHDVGTLIIQGRWKDAVNLIMQDKPDIDCEAAAKARALYREGNMQQAYEVMPNKQLAEKRILDFFVKEQKHGHNYETEGSGISAINSIPWSLRQMYVHAFQSFIWNHITSQRIQKYGFKVVVGDLVMSNNREQENDGSGYDEDQSVIIVESEEDAAKYTIDQVVLPLPGFKIKYPENEMKRAYSDLLATFNLDFESFRTNQRYVCK